MGAFLLGYDNKVDTLATLSGGSWETAMPLNNLKNRVLGIKARTTDDANASCVINIDLGASPPATQIVAVCGHNCPLGAGTITLKASNLSDYSVLTLDRSGYPSASETHHWWDLTDANHAYRYWKISYLNTSMPDNYWEVGRLFMGSVWKPNISPGPGSSFSYEDASLQEQALSGTPYFDERPRRRLLDAQFDALTNTSALIQFSAVQRLVGITGEVFAVWDSSIDGTNGYPRYALGHLVDPTPIQMQRLDQNSARVRVRETL